MLRPSRSSAGSRPPLRNPRQGTVLQQLYKERQHNRIVWTKSPYHAPTSLAQTAEALENGKESGGSFYERPHELHINVAEEVPWIDLLLELAMTTAFASLADNTPILTGMNTASFVAFFTLVWWIWASQVAYNIRFRQSDWFHRACAFLQLAVFSGMAAFTNNFDISDKIIINNQWNEAAAIELSLNNTAQYDVTAQAYRNERLPTLNARGISVVMFFSRLLMLVQYFVAFLYARRFRRSALTMHLMALLASTLCYASAFVILGHNPNKIDNIAKLILWFGAIIVEMVAHFVANDLPGRARYSPEAIKARSGTLFIIVLGTGLDRITSSFRYVVGTIGFSALSVGMLFSVAIIVIGEFSAYFATTGKLHGSNNRLLSWFFLHFPLLVALIVLLQGVVIITAYANISGAIVELLGALFPLFETIRPGSVLQASDYPSVEILLAKLGISLEDTIATLNQLCNSNPLPTFSELFAGMMHLMFNILIIAFSQYNALPQPGSLLQAKIDQFSQSSDPSIVSFNGMMELILEMITSRLGPALWFIGAAGGTLMMLAILMLIKQWPRDRWEWFRAVTWFMSGLGLAMLSLLDIHTSALNSNTILWSFEGKKEPFVFIISSWLLPIFAAALTFQNLLSVLIDLLAARAARNHIRHSTGIPEFDYIGEYQAVHNMLHARPNELGEYDLEEFDPYVAHSRQMTLASEKDAEKDKLLKEGGSERSQSVYSTVSDR